MHRAVSAFIIGALALAPICVAGPAADATRSQGPWGHPWHPPWFGWGWGQSFAWPFCGPYTTPGTIGHGSAASLPGTVVTEVRPGNAEVAIDGVAIGRAREYNRHSAPLRLSGGRHIVTLSQPGFMTLTLSLEVAPGSYYRLYERLRRGSGRDPRSVEIEGAREGIGGRRERED